MIIERKEKIFCFTILLFIAEFSFVLMGITAEGDEMQQTEKKRDPFVALVDSNGKIKSKEDLFPETRMKRSLSMNINVKAIIWDETKPLALINNKIYSEGKEITEGLVVRKIYRNSIDLDDNGNIVTIPVRKPEKR